MNKSGYVHTLPSGRSRQGHTIRYDFFFGIPGGNPDPRPQTCVRMQNMRIKKRKKKKKKAEQAQLRASTTVQTAVVFFIKTCHLFSCLQSI